MRSLNAGSLRALASQVAVPRYDRTGVTPGVVHLGVGGFHRAHQAMYLDRLLNAGAATQWGVCGVGVLPGDRRMKEALQAQDCLYTLVVKHRDGTLEPRVVGSIVEYLFTPDDPDAVVEQMAAAATRVVSLTITEGGYNIHRVTGEFDPDQAGVRHDLQPDAAPTSVFGLVVEALARRRARGLPPFTVVSCDNIETNGDVARSAFVGFARLRDAELAEWIDREVSCPNSMVDRITPATSDVDRAMLLERFGVRDAWPVVCEPFRQWVLEDRFVAGRPPLEDAGVQLVDDVRPYELMKLRLLNASHQAMAFLGYLAGYRYVHEVCQNPLFTQLLLDYMDEEATPTLAPVPGVELSAYKSTLIERFANPHVADTLARLCAETSDRIPKFLLPVIRSQLSAGGAITRSALVVAAWARYAEGVDEAGRPIEVVDPMRPELMAAAQRQRAEPTAFLANRNVFGDLVDDPRFVQAYTRWLRSLHEHGALATVERAVKAPSADSATGA